MIKINKKSIISSFLLVAVLVAIFAPITRVEAQYSDPNFGKFGGTTYTQQPVPYTPPQDPSYPAQPTNTGYTGENGTSQTSTTTYSSSNAAPLIYTTIPSSIKVGSVGINIGVIGSNFMPSSIVRWNGADRTTTFVSGTQLSVKLNDTDIAALGQYPITVFTPAPGGGISNIVTFTVDTTSPSVVTAITPTTGTTNTDTSVTTVTSTTDTKTKLSANASGGYFIWNFMYWLLLSILILVAIILWRKHYLKKKREELELGEDEEIPLKHA